MGIIRNQYVGRTFIEPTEQIRNMGVRLKLNVNRAVIAGKRVVLVDDSVVRGTTSRKIREMVRGRGRRRRCISASPRRRPPGPASTASTPPSATSCWPRRMAEEEMRAHIGVDSLRFVSLDGLYRACGEEAGRDARQPQFCDACFSGDYPVRPSDRIDQGLRDQGSGVTEEARPRRARHRREPRPRLRGRARARRRGDQVVALARTVGGLEELADAIDAAGGPNPTLVPLSMTDEGGLQRLCLAIHERWGRLDLAVHCAAHAAPLPPAAHLADQDFDQSVEVNLKGTERLIVVLAAAARRRAGRALRLRRPTTAPGSRSSAPTARARRRRRRWCGPGRRESARIGPRVELFHPNPMPTALRARFFPGEDISALAPCADEAARLLDMLAAGRGGTPPGAGGGGADAAA